MNELEEKEKKKEENGVREKIHFLSNEDAFRSGT